ncbi:negative acting factor [Verticillium dahliae VdLs.17]|uniref:Negative acting factor n=1 Tax=Verticillium dahliae (strain VdLs.17 / ATCC MYA-4575 / FGSC 10137) TaxID=498257 RepID=G2XCD4_VERDV|nr:negative acting factor [Verticillium dahliae VdLs.17]EGY16652.1 negative acting factor [Verticillium dahliae VdLs.17]
MAPNDTSQEPAGDASASTTSSSTAVAAPPPPPPPTSPPLLTSTSTPPSLAVAAASQPSPQPTTTAPSTNPTSATPVNVSASLSPAHATPTAPESDASTLVNAVASTAAPPPPPAAPAAAVSTTNAVSTTDAVQQNGDARSSSSPAMSHGQHPTGPHRPPGTYPSPNTYGSPAGAPVGPYGYGGPPQQASIDPYRASPGAQVSLPSVKSFDALQSQPQHQPPPPPPPPPQQQQQHHQHSHQHGSPHAPPQPMNMPMSMGHPQSMPYYNHMSMAPNPYQLPSDNIRYAIPPHDMRYGSGPRGPKKCDEAQPTCNNCKKSKRDCAGYDPIFKQQPGPSNIQPALNSHHQSPVSTPTVPSSLPPAPLQPSNPYGSQPSVLPSSYGPPPSASTHFDSALNSPASAKADGYGTAIDPALQNLPMLASTPNFASGQQSATGGNLTLRGPAPSPPSEGDGQVTPEVAKEITRVYHEVYAFGLDSFFETRWFGCMMTDPSTLNLYRDLRGARDVFAAFLKCIEKTHVNDRASLNASGVLETRLTWTLATLPLAVVPPSLSKAGPHDPLPPPTDPVEVRNRVFVVDVLLRGDFMMSANPLTAPRADSDTNRVREYEFWYNLAHFLCLPDTTYESKHDERETALNRIRTLLDGQENRDLLYSIAIARELAPRLDPGYETSIPQQADESEPKNRLFVASNFIRREAQVSGGTTNVVRRFSEIAIQSFINPGVNIGRLNNTGVLKQSWEE